MIFYHIQESNDQLIIIDGNDIVQIFLDIWEDIFSGTYGETRFFSWKILRNVLGFIICWNKPVLCNIK